MPGSPQTFRIVFTQRFNHFPSLECMKIPQRCPGSSGIHSQDNVYPFVFLGNTKASTLLFSGAVANRFCMWLISIYRAQGLAFDIFWSSLVAILRTFDHPKHQNTGSIIPR